MAMKTLSLIFLSLFLLSACTEQKVYSLFGKTMGTTYSVKYTLGKVTISEKALQALIDEELVHVNALMSTYIPTSEISLFNKNQSSDWTVIHQDFFYVLEHALGVSEATNGIFDPTIGPLVNLWGFGPDGTRKVPEAQKLAFAMEAVGHNLIVIDKENRRIKKLHPRLYLDLSASAKGYGVDAVAKVLDQKGIHDYMVEIGGEVKTSGLKNGHKWKIAIEAPHPTNITERYQKVVSLSNLAMATSGDYRNFFEQGGKKYSHTINFKTGKPVEHTMASVTVIDEKSCMNADAWATAFNAMGPVAAMELAEKLNIAAYFIYRLDNQENGQEASQFVSKESSAFKKIFE
ncbi:ApbE family protein [Bacteriovorax sp. BSW11_IV]|nr:ApbE family protein [Bacteriovorax sp. BSW11_IV]